MANNESGNTVMVRQSPKSAPGAPRIGWKTAREHIPVRLFGERDLWSVLLGILRFSLGKTRKIPHLYVVRIIPNHRIGDRRMRR